MQHIGVVMKLTAKLSAANPPLQVKAVEEAGCDWIHVDVMVSLSSLGCCDRWCLCSACGRHDTHADAPNI